MTTDVTDNAKHDSEGRKRHKKRHRKKKHQEEETTVESPDLHSYNYNRFSESDPVDHTGLRMAGNRTRTEITDM